MAEEDFFKKDLRIELPRQIAKLRQTGKLLLDNCQLSSVPESVWTYTDTSSNAGGDIKWWDIEPIVVADLSFNELTRLEHQWASLFGSSLQTLKLHYNSIQTIDPDTFPKFAELGYLDLSHNQLASLPEDISFLANSLVHLNLSWNKLAVLPNSFAHLKKLSHLELEGCQLIELPRDIGLLQESLAHLNVAENKLKCIPESFGKLSALKDLNLSKNSIQSVPGVFHNLKELRTLDLSYNQLSQLPRLPQQLITVIVSFNKIVSLSGSVEELKKLEFFDARNNQIQDLTPLVSCLSLKTIDASSNPLVELPYELHTLERLNKFVLENVMLKSLSRTTMNRGADAIKNFLKARGPRKIEVMSETKEELLTIQKQDMVTSHPTQTHNNNDLQNNISTIGKKLESAEAKNQEPEREPTELELLSKQISELEKELHQLGIPRHREMELKKQLALTRSKKIRLEKSQQ
eukprot:TRINITY_DN7661_c0_g1_i1.p1 TRINITY_DN7661_c0_g1~~TRINITY_DN7661_c0_g1_i1.p1  ORF type:complete len:462 (+),score=133.02 TRINITY_DN7661_c0_g1_i1:49-1434(+)